MKRIYPLLQIHIIALALIGLQTQTHAQCNLNAMITSVPDAPFCQGSTITLTAIATGGTGPYSYNWETGDTTQSIQFVVAGSDHITVTITDANGCVDDYEIKINPWLIVANIEWPSAVCEGEELELSVYIYPITLGAVIEWSNGETGLYAHITTSGTYSVTVTNPDDGCSLSDTAFIDVNYVPLPEPEIQGPAVLCPGQSANLSVTGGPYEIVIWSSGFPVANGPGIYTVFVVDENYCSGSDTLEILPGGTTPIVNGPTELCPGQTGTVEVVNAAEFTDFDWSTGETTPTITVSGPGTYTVTVADADGCTATGSVTVATGSSNINITGTTTPTTSCAAPNGAVDITASPTGTYNFNWSNGSTTEDLTNIAAGSYTVTVTDTGGCTSSASFTVANNTTPPVPTATPTPSTCGQNNGAVDLSVSPTGSYTFLWSNGATTEDIVDIAAGSYTVTVTSTSSGCTASATANVQNNNPPINITGSATPVTSCTTPNGVVDITASPTGSYDYNWSNGATTEDLQNVVAGSYTVTVSAGGSCTGSASFTVANNTTPPVPTATPTPSTCGQNNGAVDLSVSPAGNYTFFWSNGATTEDLANIALGSYTVTVTSVNSGCSANASATVQDNSFIPNITGTTTPVTSCLVPNGSISTSITPAANYSFVWSNGETTQNLSNLTAGTYSVTASAGGSCIGSANFTVGNAAVPPSLSAIVMPAICGLPEGAIDLTVAPAGNYIFSWSNGETTEDLTNLLAGNYSVTATSTGDGCTTTATYNVPDNSTNFTIGGTASPVTTCGQPNGEIDLNITPSGTYTFFWSNGEATEDLTGVPTGTYSVTVTSAGGGCTGGASFIVDEQLVMPSLSQTTAPATCGQPNGAVDLSVAPAGTYVFLWSNGATSEDLQNIAAGSYQVTVTGSNGCTSTTSATVPDNTTAINLTGTTTANTSCTSANGAVDLTASPSGNYSFSWSNGANIEDLQNIAAGNYTVTVSAGGSCTSTATYTVPNNSGAPSLTPATSPAFCGQNGGSVDLTVLPSGVYVFLWSNGATGEDLQNIAAGDYQVTVTGTNGCSSTAQATVANNTVNFNVTGTVTPDSSCVSPDGNIDLSMSLPGSYSFLWSDGATTEDLQNLAAGNYSVTCTGANGCTAVLPVEVPSENTTMSLSTLPTANLSCTSPSGAVDLTVSTIGTYTCVWSNGETTEDLSNLPSGSYVVTVTDALGCTETSTATVGGPTQPQVAVTGPASACTGQTATLTADLGFSTYLWSNGATTNNINVSQTGTYSVTATDSNGCTATDEQIFQNLPLPTPIINGPAAICGGDAVFSVTGGIFTQINWSTGEATPSITVSQTGIYTVTVTNADGCTATASQNLDVGTSLLPAITTDTSNCNGTATLDAGSGYASYLWSDGSTGQMVLVNANGAFAVTVSDGTGCTGEAAVALSIPPPPQVAITGNNSICSGNRAQFSVPNNFTQIIWSTGETTTTITVSQPAVYGVTVTDANGCTASASQMLTVGAGLLPDITVTLADCDGTSTLDAGGGYANYLWSDGSTGQLLLVNANGAYTVTVSDASGCTGEAVENVVLPMPPQIVISGAANLCQGDETVLAAPGNFDQYLWSTGETTPQITIQQGGIYAVTVSDANGCTATDEWMVTQLQTDLVMLETSTCSVQDTGTVEVVFTNQFGCDSSVVTVTVLAQPVFTNIEQGACAGESTIFNGVTIPVGSSQDFVFAAANGCDSIVSVNVVAFPAVNFDLETTRACHNSADGGISVSMLGGEQPYQYSLNGGAFQNAAIFTGLPSGNYAVMVSDANGCVFEQTAEIGETAPIEVLVEDAVLSCEKSTVLLRPIVVSAGADVSYLWPDGSAESYFLAENAGVYEVLISDGCGEVQPYEMAVTWERGISPQDAFYIPNCFSPNNDGINDEFRVFPGPDFEVVNFEFKVFDRWGDMMFGTVEVSEGWDGIYREVQKQPAVYVWYVKARLILCDGREVDFFREGGVTIIR